MASALTLPDSPSSGRAGWRCYTGAMAGILDDLAEARIADWQRRVAAGEVSRDAEPLPMDTIENQLFKEILALFDRARPLQGDERAALLREANRLRMQLIIGLEKTNPMAAAQLDDRLARARPRWRD